MAVSQAHRDHWQQRWAREAAKAEQRLKAARQQAVKAAAALKHDWPQVTAVWLFGSASSGRFTAQSDIDLAVEGLPADALLLAMARLEQAGFIPVDLVRLEALPSHWQQRIHHQALQLA